MYTKGNYSLKDMVKWTLKDTYKYLIIAIIPVILYDLLNLRWLHLPWLPIALIGTAVAFLISFKNNASYDRLWEARKIWGGIVNTSRSFGMLINNYITQGEQDKVSEDQLQAIRKTIVKRHIAWMTAHRYALRQPKPWEVFMKNHSGKSFLNLYKIDEFITPFDEAIKPYLSEKECNQIQNKRSPASQILKLQSDHLKQLKDQGLIWKFSHLEMEQLLVEMFTLQGKNERIKNFPYPRQFATLNLFIVWIFILFLPFGIMSEFDKIGMNLLAGSDITNMNIINRIHLFMSRNFVWLSVPFTVIVTWVFHTMERIGEVSENPFEGTANDVPITTMARDIEIDILEIIGETKVPESIPASNYVQM